MLNEIFTQQTLVFDKEMLFYRENCSGYYGLPWRSGWAYLLL